MKLQSAHQRLAQLPERKQDIIGQLVRKALPNTQFEIRSHFSTGPVFVYVDISKELHTFEDVEAEMFNSEERMKKVFDEVGLKAKLAEHWYGHKQTPQERWHDIRNRQLWGSLSLKFQIGGLNLSSTDPL